MLTPPIDPAILIRDVNASNDAVEDQCLRARHAADTASRSARAAQLSAEAAHAAAVAHRAVQAERPRRSAPLPLQVILAFGSSSHCSESSGSGSSRRSAQAAWFRQLLERACLPPRRPDSSPSAIGPCGPLRPRRLGEPVGKPVRHNALLGRRGRWRAVTSRPLRSTRAYCFTPGQ
jgi:hypothetical protein